jgi:hypothetical protein
MVINELPKVIQQYGAKMVVISDLLGMFMRDPQIEIGEARYLINEIVNSITKTRVLEDVLVIVSYSSSEDKAYPYNNKSALLCNKTILPRFNKCLEITNNDDEKNNNMINIKIRNNSNKIRRIKNTDNHFHDSKLLSINQRDLLIIH